MLELRVDDDGYGFREGGNGLLTVSRPRLIVPTNLEMATVRDMMKLAKPVRASMVEVEAILVTRYKTIESLEVGLETRRLRVASAGDADRQQGS